MDKIKELPLHINLNYMIDGIKKYAHTATIINYTYTVDVDGVEYEKVI